MDGLTDRKMKDRKGLCNDLVKTDKDQPLGARL